MTHARTLETVVAQVNIPFRPKHDPSRNLAEEIESCKRKIWDCVDPTERKEFLEKKQKKNEKQYGKIEINKENSKYSTKKTAQKTEELTIVENAPKNKIKLHLTRTDIELKVFVMKVVELKRELKSRGQDTGGLKKDLRTRLINVMMKDVQRDEVQAHLIQNNLYCSSDSVIVEEFQEEQNDSSGGMNISTDSREKSEMEVENSLSSRQLPLDNNESFKDNLGKTSISSMQVEHHNEAAEQAKTKKDNFMGPSSSEQNQGQNRPITETKEYLKKSEASLSAIKEIDSVPSNSSSIIPDGSNQYHFHSQGEKSELTENKIKNISESDARKDSSGPSSEVSCSSKTSGNSVKDMVSKFSGFSSNLSGKSGSALSKGLQAKKEARQAKIAEMRAKAQSKPVTATKVALTSKEYSSTLSSLNATTSTTSTKKKNLATQMREKAAARAFQNKLASSVTKTGPKIMTTSSNKRHAPLANNSNNANSFVPDSLGATLKQAPSIKKPLKLLSPMDTYEISDREDSETDDSDSESENEKPKKKIPTWAQRANLYAALEEQYNGRIGSLKVDPDDIFPEVQSCDLEAIFGPKKSKLYKKRASSGNWANDRVTVAEKLIYKREMGFATDANCTDV